MVYRLLRTLTLAARSKVTST